MAHESQIIKKSLNPLKYFLFLIALTAGSTDVALSQETTNHFSIERFIAIDDVCAWPNLTRLQDGTIIATIFNQPSHGRAEGDVECWSSKSGEFWTKRGTAAQHEPMMNRMNVGAGLNKNGELVILASGWSLKQLEDGKLGLGKTLPMWSCTSKDESNWAVNKGAFPQQSEAGSNFIPFGGIFAAEDGSLRGAVYASGLPGGHEQVWMANSGDEGRTWKLYSLIGTDHNETELFPLPHRGWIATARRSGSGMGLDLFRSDDDGKTWKASKIAGENQGPANLTRLVDGRLLLSYGNRTRGQYGVVVRFSKDDGETWSQPEPLVNDLRSGDCGYPSSVQRLDGNIVTAYYARTAPDHQRYHMGVAIWSPPAADNFNSNH